jgi:hypothetical protein
MKRQRRGKKKAIFNVRGFFARHVFVFYWRKIFAQIRIFRPREPTSREFRVGFFLRLFGHFSRSMML